MSFLLRYAWFLSCCCWQIFAGRHASCWWEQYTGDVQTVPSWGKQQYVPTQSCQIQLVWCGRYVANAGPRISTKGPGNGNRALKNKLARRSCPEISCIFTSTDAAQGVQNEEEKLHSRWLRETEQVRFVLRDDVICSIRDWAPHAHYKFCLRRSKGFTNCEYKSFKIIHS